MAVCGQISSPTNCVAPTDSNLDARAPTCRIPVCALRTRRTNPRPPLSPLPLLRPVRRGGGALHHVRLGRLGLVEAPTDSRSRKKIKS